MLLMHDGCGHLGFNDDSQCIDDAIVRYVVDLVTQALGPMYAADPDALRHLMTGRRRQLRSRDDGRSIVDIADAASSFA